MQVPPPPPRMIICCGRANESCLWFVSCSSVSLFSSPCSLFVTTSRQRGLRHQRGCFRHSPCLLIADKAGHPPCPRLQPVAESGVVFLGTRGRCSRASAY